MTSAAIPPFNVFLAWSGPSSQAIAKALQSWLPTVVQRAKPWMSDIIDKGSLWRAEISRRLGTIKIGVLCLTKDNYNSTWLHFEAGALARFVDDESHVIPYLFDIDQSAYKDPLAMFQATKADREGTRALVHSINKAMDESIHESTLTASFNALWPALEKELREAGSLSSRKPIPQRSERDILIEILKRVRALGHPGDKPFSDLVSDSSLDEVILEYISDDNDRPDGTVTQRSQQTAPLGLGETQGPPGGGSSSKG